jgi:hypothetical protein
VARPKSTPPFRGTVFFNAHLASLILEGVQPQEFGSPGTGHWFGNVVGGFVHTIMLPEVSKMIKK